MPKGHFLILKIQPRHCWFIHIMHGFEFECDEISSKRKSTLIDRIEWLKYGDLNKSGRPICIKIYANWKNIRVFFWKIGTFFQDTNDKSCLIVSNLGVQNEGTTHREEESNEVNRKCSWVFTNYPWKWRGYALWDNSLRHSANIIFWEEMSKTFVHVWDDKCLTNKIVAALRMQNLKVICLIVHKRVKGNI